jgi:thiol-disulfide isomerase/thioredoxin
MKAQPFKPKRAPSQASADRDAELPADPLKVTRGHWTWINFWAAWCVPCREELPLLLSWQKQLAGKVSFDFVSIDDDERQLREFLGRQTSAGLRQSYWLPDGAVRLAWLEALHLETEPELPLQLLIDPEGQLRCRVQGAIEAKDLEILERIVRN